MASENNRDEGVPNITLPGYICDDEESTHDPLFVMDWRSLIPQPVVNKIDKKLQNRGGKNDKIKDKQDIHHKDEESEKEESLDEDDYAASSEENEERMEKKFKKIRKKLAREFIHETTLHGVNYMSNPDHSVRRR